MNTIDLKCEMYSKPLNCSPIFSLETIIHIEFTLVASNEMVFVILYIYIKYTRASHRRHCAKTMYGKTLNRYTVALQNGEMIEPLITK